jgi:hypothetical protein
VEGRRERVVRRSLPDLAGEILVAFSADDSRLSLTSATPVRGAAQME